MTTPEFLILRDTREQTPWEFRKGRGCLGVETATLATGDYTIKGYETKVIIERKGCVSEVAGNLYEPRFEREMERLVAFDYPFVVCQFPFTHLVDYPKGSGLPFHVQRRVKLRGSMLLRRLNELYLAFPKVRWQFCETESAAKSFALSLFKRVVERHA